MKKFLFFAIVCFISAAVFAQTQQAKVVLNNKFKHHQTTKTIGNKLQHQGISALEPNSLNYYPQKAIVYLWDNTGVGSWQYNNVLITHYNSKAKPVYDLRTDTVTATPQSKDTSTYDLNGNQLTELTQTWQSGAWVNSYRYTYTYDSQSNQTLDMEESWQNNAWVISYGYKNINAYDGNNNMTEDLSQDWNTSTLAWENSYKTDMTYSGNLMTEETDYVWQNNAWASSDKYTNIVWQNYTNWQVKSYTEQHWVNNSWTNYANFSATYTGNNYIGITDTIVSSNWVHYQRETYTEDVNGGSVDLYEIYQNSSWVNDSQYSRYFDTHKNYTGYKDESWSSGSWATTYQFNYILTYNGNIVTERISQGWDYTNLVLVNSEKDVYSNFIQLDDGNGIVTTISSNNDIQVYPNPAKDKIIIELQRLNNIQKNIISIYNIQGQTILQQSLQQEKTELDISRLAKGIYILKSSNDEKMEVIRIVKE